MVRKIAFQIGGSLIIEAYDSDLVQNLILQSFKESAKNIYRT